MANEAQIKVYTTVNHVVDGAAIAAAGFSAISDVDTSIDNSTNLAPLCNLILSIAGFATAPVINEAINVYRNDVDIKSTNDEPVVDANYKQHYVGSFVPDLITGAQYLQIQGIPLPPGKCNFILENGTSYQLSVNWDLDVQPYTFAPAA